MSERNGESCCHRDKKEEEEMLYCISLRVRMLLLWTCIIVVYVRL